MEGNYAKRERMSGAVNALSLSPEGNSVVVAGRESNVKAKKESGVVLC